MGAVTSHPKRGNNNWTLDFTYPFLHFNNYDNQIHTHVSKKQKISSLMSNQSTSSLNSRINRYPDPQKLISREIHAPCRGNKVGFTGYFRRSFNRVFGNGYFSDNVGENEILRENGVPYRGHGLGLPEIITSNNNNGFEDEVLFDKCGEELYLRYERTKKVAVESFRYYKNDKRVNSVNELIILDKEDDDDDVRIVETRGINSDSENRRGNLNTILLDSVDDDVLEFAVDKNLLENSERNNDNLSSLSLDIELNEKRLASIHLDHRAEKTAQKDLFREAFVPLTDEEKNEVSQAFSEYNRRKVLVTHVISNIDITGDVLQCLRPGQWLNDEVINVYFHLLKERQDREPKFRLKCHFFNTFFYKKLIGGKNGYDYKSVRRWTTQKKLGYNLSECDKIFVPIHKQAHWCLAVINKKDRMFQYLDSLGGTDPNVLRVLAMYFADELKDKNGVDIDVFSWMQENVVDIPKQKNGSDCGMFMIKYADFYSRGLGLCFNQEHMPYFRLRTAKEILRLEAK